MIQPITKKIIKLPLFVAMVHLRVGVLIAGIQPMVPLKCQHLGYVGIVIAADFHVQSGQPVFGLVLL